MNRASPHVSSRVLKGFLLALLAVGLYANTLTNGYVLDDKAVITGNALTRQGFHAIGELFTRPQYFGAIDRQTRLYRPVPMATHAVEYGLFGENPAISHAVNVFLYALLVAVLFLLLTRWTGDRWPDLPFLAVLLFTAHPLHTEVVANIKGRDEILVLLFCALSASAMFGYARDKRPLSLASGVICFLLALFSKESALPFLVIIPLSLWFFSGKERKPQIIASLALLASVAFYLVVRSFAVGGTQGYHLFRSFIYHAPDQAIARATAMSTFLDYLKLLVFPHPLIWSYSWYQVPLAGWTNWKVIASVALLAGMGFYAVKLFRRKSLVSFCILFFLLSWVLTSNLLLPVSAVFAERFMFTPSLAFSILLALLLQRVKGAGDRPFLPLKRPLEFRNLAFVVFTGALLTAFSVKTVIRNTDWKDDFTILTRDIRYQPRNVMANFFVGEEYFRKSIQAEGEERDRWLSKSYDFLQRSVAVDTSFYEGNFLLGILRFHGGDYPEAIRRFGTALRINPDFSDTLYSAEKAYGFLATAFIRQNILDSAVAEYGRLIAFVPAGRPPQQDARFAALQNRGSLLNRQRRYGEAVPDLKKALEINPGSGVTWLTLGMSYFGMGNKEEAGRCVSKAIELDPGMSAEAERLGIGGKEGLRGPK